MVARQRARRHGRASARSAAWSRVSALGGMVARPARTAAWSRVPRARRHGRASRAHGGMVARPARTAAGQDVGYGGGLSCQPLGRCGADVVVFEGVVAEAAEVGAGDVGGWAGLAGEGVNAGFEVVECLEGVGAGTVAAENAQSEQERLACE
jgi:hypothetical protein